MAVDVGKSPSEASLSGKAEGDGRWDSAEVETDFQELAGSLQRLLGTEEAKPSLQGTESVTVSRRSHPAPGVTQGGSSCHPEVSSASAPGFPRARANPSGKGALVDRAADGGPVSHRVGYWFLSSEEQQVRGFVPAGVAAPPGSPRRGGDLFVRAVPARAFHLSEPECTYPCPCGGEGLGLQHPSCCFHSHVASAELGTCSGQCSLNKPLAAKWLLQLPKPLRCHSLKKSPALSSCRPSHRWNSIPLPASAHGRPRVGLLSPYPGTKEPFVWTLCFISCMSLSPFPFPSRP